MLELFADQLSDLRDNLHLGAVLRIFLLLRSFSVFVKRVAHVPDDLIELIYLDLFPRAFYMLTVSACCRFLGAVASALSACGA